MKSLTRQQDDLSRLMEAYQRGDSRALEMIYGKLCHRLRQYFLSHCLNVAKAEDLVQETFLQVHRSRRTYLPGKPVLPWVIGIARHVLLMDRRSSARYGRLATETDDGVLPDIPVPPDLERLANYDLVRRALLRVSPDQREALILHHVWGMSYQEIGKALGVMAGTVKLRAFRAVRELRKVLKNGVTEMDEAAK